MGVLGFWSGWSPTKRLEVYTLQTLYVFIALAPVILHGLLLNEARAAHEAPAGRVIVTAVAAVTAAAGIWTAQAAARHYLGGPAVPRERVALLLACAAVTAGLAVTLLAAPVRYWYDGASLVITMAAMIVLCALAPALRARWIVLGSALVALSTAGFLALVRDVGPLVLGLDALVVFLISGGMAGSFRISVWLLVVTLEQERMRSASVQLAVAEERLRFSRDLHDTVGRSLAAIAVKSELAAELARRGHAGAAAEMAEVRRLAEGVLAEVRAVVSGYRRADLAQELDGARSVLRSAGVGTEVVGSEIEVPDPVQEALAWVIRESTTNVVRHSHARRCVIELTEADGVARLRVWNDGVRPGGGAARLGNGLNGLAERLGTVSGTLEIDHDGGTFQLLAAVPFDASRASGVGEGLTHEKDGMTG